MDRNTTIFLILFFCMLNLYPDTSDSVVPVDNKHQWIVGITEFKGVGLSVENKYLTKSLPLIILKEISGCDIHKLSEAERSGYKNNLFSKTLDAEAEELSSLYYRKDKLFFQNTSNIEEIRSLDKEIEIKIAHISRLEAVKENNLIDIDIRMEKAIAFLEINLNGKLIVYPETSITEYADIYNPDLLFTGFIEEVEGWIYVEINCYNYSLGEVIPVYQGASSPSGVNNQIGEAIQKTITMILGRPWSSLDIQIEPENAEITLNDVTYGKGDIRIPFLLPGDYTVLASADGFFTLELPITLVNEAAKSIVINLDKDISRSILVNSVPSGADIYISSVWQGKTPYFIEIGNNIEQLELKKDNFRNSLHYITSQTEDEIIARLIPEIITFNDQWNRSREKFYFSMGLFSLSLPITMIAWAVSEDHTRMVNNYHLITGTGNTVQYNKLLETNSFLYYTYLGGLYLNGILLIDMIFKLIDYMRISDSQVSN